MAIFSFDLGIPNGLENVLECRLDSCPDNVILGHILRVCTSKQGVGLDFVRQPGYGHRRWLGEPGRDENQAGDTQVPLVFEM